jgi:hypothetical protein
MNAPHPRRWFAFRLRTMFFLVAVAACALYWVMLPTVNARQFISAVNAGQYDVAERLCVSERDKFPGSWTKHSTFNPHAVMPDLTWADLIRGVRPFAISITYGDSSGIATCAQECRATRAGIELGAAFP